jgi:hypothetical protein
MIKSYYCFILFCLLLGSAISQTKTISYNDKRIVYEGRLPYAKDAAELTWPGTSVRINFKGTGISGTFKDQDTANYYNVIIDNDSMYEIQFGTSKQTVALATGLPYAKHSLQLFKRTEWDKGKTFFYGFEFKEKSKILKPAKLPRRKIEFFGNSKTFGYAINDPLDDSGTVFDEKNYDA